MVFQIAIGMFLGMWGFTVSLFGVLIILAEIDQSDGDKYGY